jgi:hypothetical protein
MVKHEWVVLFLDVSMKLTKIIIKMTMWVLEVAEMLRLNQMYSDFLIC